MKSATRKELNRLHNDSSISRSAKAAVFNANQSLTEAQLSKGGLLTVTGLIIVANWILKSPTQQFIIKGEAKLLTPASKHKIQKSEFVDIENGEVLNLRGYKQNAVKYLEVLEEIGAISLEFRYVPLAKSNGYKLNFDVIMDLIENHPITALTSDTIVRYKEPTKADMDAYHKALAEQIKKLSDMEDKARKTYKKKRKIIDFIKVLGDAEELGYLRRWADRARTNNLVVDYVFEIYANDKELMNDVASGEVKFSEVYDYNTGLIGLEMMLNKAELTNN